MNLRSLAAAALAMPVLAAVYVRVVTASRAATRSAVVVALALAATSVGVLAPSIGTGRTAERGAATIPPEGFRAIVAGAGDAGGGPSTRYDAGGPPSALSGAAGSVRRPTVAHEPPADRAGEIALAAAQPAPTVVRFRPRDGSKGVASPIEVSVRFDQPMDRSATTAAFTIEVDGASWAGKAVWAESDTVLVVRLARRPPAGAQVVLAVSAEARSAAGRSLPARFAASFSVATPPPPRPAAPTPRPATTPRASPSGWSWPLDGPITQRFGQSLTKYGYHQGIDIDGDTGDPVRAARAGRVTLAGTGDSCGGIQVHLDHGDGLETWYRHLSVLSVKVGQQVDRGQVVGKVGATGCALGSHLHFGVRLDGTFVDPLRYLPRR